MSALRNPIVLRDKELEREFQEACEDAWHCPYCGETDGEPLYLEGRSPSRWYNGEEGDPGEDGFDGCTLCDPRKRTREQEAAEIAAFYGNSEGGGICPF